MQSPNNYHSPMDYRSIPLAIPLKSPSPDCKSINIITPTISPNVIQIKKQSTLKKNEYQKQNIKYFQQFNTQNRYYSYSPAGQQPNNIIKQKDDIIAYLRHIINIITENNTDKKQNNVEYDNLKNQVKILTIQNQKLVNRIQRSQKLQNIDQNYNKFNQYQLTIKQLNNTIKQNKIYYQEQIKQLKKYIKNINIQISNTEVQKNNIENENKKLLKILLQKNQTDLKYRQKIKSFQLPQNTQQKNQNLFTNKNQQKLTLIKIKQQYTQNIKILKKQLTTLIQQIFQNLTTDLQNITTKINILDIRLKPIQQTLKTKITIPHPPLDKLPKNTKTPSPNSDHLLQYDQLFINKKNNSEIYIEEGPQTSHQKISHAQFTSVNQEDIQQEKYNKKYDLSHVKPLRYQQKPKLEKPITDIPKHSFTKKSSSQSSQKYRCMFQQLKSKQKQITNLQNKLTSLIQQHDQYQKQTQSLLQHQLIQIQKIKKNEQNEINQIKKQTQLQVKLLIENYEQQLEMMRRQILIKNVQLNQFKQSGTLDKLENTKKIQEIICQKNIVEQQNILLHHKIQNLQDQILDQQEQSQKIKKTLQYQLSSLQHQYDNTLKKRQQVQQQAILKIAQLNQSNIQLDELKSDLIKKTQQLSQLKQSLQQQLNLIKKTQQQNKNLQQLLLQKQAYITTLLQNINQWKNPKLLQQINLLKQLLIKNQQIYQNQSFTQHSISSSNQIINKQLMQINKLKQQNQILLASKNKIQQANIQLSSKITQLQNRYKYIKNKLYQQQQLYQQLVNQYEQLKKYTTNLQISKQQLLIKYNNKNNQQFINKLLNIQHILQAKLLSMELITNNNHRSF